MTVSTEPQRLLHITHARQDEPWVRGVLIPALGLTEGQYWTRAEDDLGALKLEELERAVQSCRYTLLVASSAARVDQWTQFAGLLAEHLGIEEGKPRLLLVARDFEPGSERAREVLPLRQRCLLCLDCSDPEQTPVALAALAAQLALTTTESVPTECPYPGLRMFGAGDAGGNSFARPDLFFGRDDEAREIIEQLRTGGRVLLVGPSGCGKSSLVRARVLPTLGQGPDAMPIAQVVRLGAHPDVALRAALDALDPRLGQIIEAYLQTEDEIERAALIPPTGPRRLIYLDHLEEVFLDDDDDRHEHARFFARLTALGRVPGVAILLAMRADFYADLMRSALWEDFKDHRVELSPLRGAALRLVITRPAEVVGVHVEADLVERLVREADQDRAAEALPLLQVALEELWRQREWRYLSLASYARIVDGDRRGLDVVFARHADATMAALPAPAQRLARRVLIDLVHLGEGRPDTRRRRSVSELRRAGDGDELARVLEHLSARRLIAISGAASEVAAVWTVALDAHGSGVADMNASDSAAGVDPVIDADETGRHVDLAHDTLITGWPMLASWIAERRRALRTQRRLESRAAIDGLLSTGELPEFSDWLTWIATPSGQEHGASHRLRRLFQRSVRVRRVRRRWRLSAVLAALVGVAAAAGVFRWQRGIALENLREAERSAQAEEDARLAVKRELARALQETGRQLLLDGRPFEALPYLVEARKEGESGIPLRMLFSAAARHVPDLWLEHRDPVRTAAFSPDGKRIVTASDDRTARIWDARTGEPLSPALEHDDKVTSAAFSPDGARVVTVSVSKTARVWDATTGKLLSPALAHQSIMNSAAFSPDGTRVVTASADQRARVWNATTGEPLSPWLVHPGAVLGAVFSPDGARVLTACYDAARIWNPTTGESVISLLRSDEYELMSSAAFSADGRRVVTASRNGTARVWDAATGKPLLLSLKHEGAWWSPVFSADGTRIVTAGSDTEIWTVATGSVVRLRHRHGVLSAAFSADGTRVITAHSNHIARIWDARHGEVLSGQVLSVPFQHHDRVNSVAFRPDGARVVTASTDGTAGVWDVAASVPGRPPLRHPGVRSAAFSPDGARVVTASADDVRVWEAGASKPVTGPLQDRGTVLGVAFSTEGARVVTASAATARVWDAALGKALTPPLQHRATVRSAVFSPDGTKVVTASEDGLAVIWATATGKPLAPALAHPGAVLHAAFSPDGTRVVTASHAKTAQVWDATAGKPISPPLRHRDVVSSVAFSPDGRRVVTASLDNTARIWDATTGEPLSPPFGHRDTIASAVFSPDGTRVVTASADRTARVWDAITGEPRSPLLEHHTRVVSAAFSPDGARIVTVSIAVDHSIGQFADEGLGTGVHIWDATTGKRLAMPLDPHRRVYGAAFSPDGTRIVIASDDVARVWEIPLDDGTLADWSAVAARSPYVLVNDVLVRRSARIASPTQPSGPI